MKTKGYEEQRQKSKNYIRVALCLKTAWKKTPQNPKIAQFLKGGKNGHFAKAIAKHNGHKRSILVLSFKITKKNRNYPPFKPLELIYAENCAKTHLILEK